MEFGITALGAILKRHFEAVREASADRVDGDIPVSKVPAVDTLPAIRDLVDNCVVTLPRSTSRPPAVDLEPVEATGSVADLVSAMRD